MLVLSRKLGEKIVIADNIVLTIIEIQGGKVRIGIEAPPEVRVDRQEVRDAQNRRAKNPPDYLREDR